MQHLSTQHFWEWFKRNNHEFKSMKNTSTKEFAYWTNELNIHLRSCARILNFIIESREDRSFLTITVFGKAKYFQKVDNFVASSIEISGWTFEALDCPHPIDFMLEPLIQITNIDPREFQFALSKDDTDEKSIYIYHPLCNIENSFPLDIMANRAVFNLLGERIYGTEVKDIIIANLSCTSDEKLENLENLPSLFPRKRSRISVDANGNLIL